MNEQTALVLLKDWARGYKIVKDKMKPDSYLDKFRCIPSDHFITWVVENSKSQWMIYGTGPIQDIYLAAAKISSDLNCEEKNFFDEKIDKKNLLQASNYWINTDKIKTNFEKRKRAPVKINPSSNQTHASDLFLDRFNKTGFSINKTGYNKLLTGAYKSNALMEARVNEVISKNKEEAEKYSHNKLSQKAANLKNAIYSDMGVEGTFLRACRTYFVRRGCKYLLYEAVQKNKTVFYALDNLDIVKMADNSTHDEKDKKGNIVFSKVPICTSEVRELFRYWYFYKKNVIFCKNFRFCKPPWDSSIATHNVLKLWASYALKRANKILFLPGNLNKTLVKLLQLSVEKFYQGDYIATIEYYHSVDLDKHGFGITSKVNVD